VQALFASSHEYVQGVDSRLPDLWYQTAETARRARCPAALCMLLHWQGLYRNLLDNMTRGGAGSDFYRRCTS
jgi:hypothetical protein